MDICFQHRYGVEGHGVCLRLGVVDHAIILEDGVEGYCSMVRIFSGIVIHLHIVTIVILRFRLRFFGHFLRQLISCSVTSRAGLTGPA